MAPPGRCWETQALGCGRKAGGTTRISNSASTRNPRVHSDQSHPEIKIWEAPNQNCLQTVHQLFHVYCQRHNVVALSHTLTLLLSRYPHHSHSLQNTFSLLITLQNMDQSGQHHKHSGRDLLMYHSLKLRLQNTNFSLNCHTPKHRELSCAQKHSFAEKPLSLSFFYNCTAGSQVSPQSHQDSPLLPMSTSNATAA